MIGKVIDFVKKKPGLSIIIIILSVITLANIKPDFYLAGWDNYSSYFNLDTSIFRTLFATWREYRGLGAASDAEVTDVFRQIFYYAAHLVFPEQLLDQIYYLLSLWVGILSTYAVSNLIFKKFFNKSEDGSGRGVDVFSTLVSLFYLFNLNTLSIFSSPIIPFTNRFYSMPLTIYFFLRFLQSSHKKKDFLWLALSVIVTAGSYVTPTVFITSFVAFGILSWFTAGFKKTVIYSSVFLLLNAFWLLPFANYTIKKSPTIPLARTFIEINESTLNQPKSNFELGKQAALFPSFFDIKFPSLNGATQNIHPLLDDYNKPFNQKVFLVFPIVYTIGGILIIKDWKRKRKLLWLPVWIVVFLFLSTKQYGPLGFLYSFMDKNIPFFGIIFRIGDTKFHAYINFAGSILAGYSAYRLWETIKEKRKYLLIVPPVVIVFFYYAFLFRSYFTGNLINYVLYVKIPKAYYDVAEKINNDPGKSRVLHLPFDSWHHYWRSYSWGYLGSAFYNFFLDKPYIDKTFEPASMENVYLHNKINSLITSFYRASDEAEKAILADRFYDLAYKTGMKYIILDESISSSIYSKNINYTAKQSYVASQAMMEHLSSENRVVRTDFDFDLTNFYADYKKIFPIDRVGLPSDLPQSFRLSLYELPDIRPEVSFLENARVVDSKLANALETDIDKSNLNDYIQDDAKDGAIYPFMQQNHKAIVDESSVNLRYANNLKGGRYSVQTMSTAINTRMYDFYGREVNGEVFLDIYHRYLPDINGVKYQKFVGTVFFKKPSKTASLSDYRFSVDGTASSLPVKLEEKAEYIASFLVKDHNINVSFLDKDSEIVIDPNSFENRSSLSDCPFVKGVVLELGMCNKPYFVDSTIVLPRTEADIQYYVEPNLLMSGIVEGESRDAHGLKPVHSYACFSQSANGDCVNLHRNLLLDAQTKKTFAEGFFASNQVPLSVQIGSIPFDDFQQSVKVEKFSLKLFKVLGEKSITVSDSSFNLDIDMPEGDLALAFPKALSNNSFYFDRNKDFYDKTTAPCGGGKTKRLNRVEEGILINKMEGCLSAFAQIFNYSYGNPYLFTADYWLGSGQQPLFSLKKESDTYLIERMSIYQGYPNIKGMKGDEVVMTTGSRIIEPRYHSDVDSSKIEVNIFQDTINQGNLALGGINMIELPTDWYSMAITPANNDLFYDMPQAYEEKSILPSLKKVSVKGGGGQGLLYFNEGYDRDWGVYDGFLSVITGKQASKTLRCSGYANCFEIELSQDKNYYLLYWPEKLYFFGWVLTIIALIAPLKILKKEPLTTE